ncbi:hypothetical protein KUW14_08740 [Pseudooceanicola nitratireducens]|uniref:hypothetical protein n=1 Tax=Pseudooceanicola nitratireducens TaxID=517719 RepID=UPI001C939D37|nr:hypothetical protein [Pseudooceanicola nitratireducens]MBY6165929.1 hypothetical protein [Pseudooceanicola nitratireducens]
MPFDGGPSKVVEQRNGEYNAWVTPTEIGKASFQRAGFSSVLSMIADFGTGFAGVEPIFDYRSSGGGLLVAIVGNPSADLVINAQRGMQGAVAAAVNPDYGLLTPGLQSTREGAVPPKRLLGSKCSCGIRWGIAEVLELRRCPMAACVMALGWARAVGADLLLRAFFADEVHAGEAVGIGL